MIILAGTVARPYGDPLGAIPNWEVVDAFCRDIIGSEEWVLRTCSSYRDDVKILQHHKISVWARDEASDRMVKYGFNSDKMSVSFATCNLILMFEDEQDETIFRLKYL